MMMIRKIIFFLLLVVQSTGWCYLSTLPHLCDMQSKADHTPCDSEGHLGQPHGGRWV